MILEIPLTSDPSQQLVVQLARVKYRLDVKFNSRSQVWTMDIIVNSTKVVLVRSIALVLGVDLLNPYNLGIGRIRMGDSSGRKLDATSEDLGTRVKMFWYSPEEG